MSVKIVIWNVEHGNALSIITPNGKRIVKDLGANFSTSFSPIGHQTKFRGGKIDALIVSHPHRDHIDDILSLSEHGLDKNIRHFIRPMRIDRNHLNEYILKSNVENLQEKDKNKYNAYFDLHERFPNTYITKNSPLHPENNGGVKFEFFKPNKTSLGNINNHSVVSIISYLDKKVMLTGDNEASSWKELLSNPKFRAAIEGVDIFLASHHGRPNGFHEELFTYFKPKLVLISDGPGSHKTAIRDYYNYVDKPYEISFNNDGQKKRRKCLTTRDDNAIILTLEDGDHIHVKTKTSPKVQGT